MIAKLKDLWVQHGTKILGAGGVVLSSLSLIDHETLQLIESTFGPVYGPRVTHGLAIFGGVMTAYRGFKNSQPK
jgi:hypothetical protein